MIDGWVETMDKYANIFDVFGFRAILTLSNMELQGEPKMRSKPIGHSSVSVVKVIVDF